MIRLASRLTAGSGRESLIRVVLTGAGLAVATTMLLFATVAFPALHAHDVRRAWTETSEENSQPAQDEATTDPLLWRLTESRFEGHDVMRVDVAAEDPDAPVPPGLDRLPAPGELAVSPALRDLLAGTDPAMLGDRFPGRITATVGRDALASPEDLVVFVGRSPDQLHDEDGVITVRSIEAAPISRDLTRLMRVVFVVGGAGLLVPVVVFVATATRLAAARRERRLAALRLAGATQGQVGLVAAVEAALATVAGTAVGFAAFFALRSSVARIPFDGASFYPSDLRLSLPWAALVAFGVPALAVGAALVSLRRVRISPLGVARQASPSRPSARWLLLVAGGMALLLAVVAWAGQAGGGGSELAIAFAAGAAVVVMIVGIALSGPWFTALVARPIARFGRRAPSLLAARRLQDNPAAGFRAISGVTLAVFVGTVLSGMASSIMAMDHGLSARLPADVVAAAPSPHLPPPPSPDFDPARADGATMLDTLPRWPTVAPARTGRLVDELTRVPGVHDAVVLHPLPDDPALMEALVRSGAGVGAPVLVSCADAPALGLDCAGTGTSTGATGDDDGAPDGGGRDGAGATSDGDRVTVANVWSDGIQPTEFVTSLPHGTLAGMPTATVAAVTDGRDATVERARTLLEVAFPGAPAVTAEDIDAETRGEWRTMQRVSNIALATTLIIAGCSLAVAVAGSIVERKQPLALLRLAGTRLSDLRRMVLAEAAAPLLIVAVACVGLGLATAALVIATGTGADQDFVLPGVGYWLSLLGGLVVALLVVLATLPLLDRLTALDAARFE